MKVDNQVDSLQDSSYTIRQDLTSIEYTSSEQVIINHALSIITKYSESEITQEDIIEDLSILKDNYNNVKRVISRNFDKYPEDVRNRFLKYDEVLISLDKNIKKASQEEDYISSAKMVVMFAMNVIKAALALK